MKKTKTEEIDPIMAKYNKKLGFFKKIQVNFNKKKELYNKNKDLKDDVKSFVSIGLGIVLYGLLGSLAATLVGIPISIMSFFGIGSLLWLIENKFIEFITRILGSIKLISVNQ
jgi:hypothetical protein